MSVIDRSFNMGIHQPYTLLNRTAYRKCCTRISRLKSGACSCGTIVPSAAGGVYITFIDETNELLTTKIKGDHITGDKLIVNYEMNSV